MARQDIAGLLTGMPQQQRPNPNMSSAEWRLAFGQQQSDNMARGLQGAVGGLMGTGMAGAASPQEQIQIADLKAQERIGKLATSQDPAELRQAAQLLQQRNKPAEAARALGQAKAIEDKIKVEALRLEAQDKEQERFEIGREDKAKEFDLAERKMLASEKDLSARGLDTIKVERYDPVTGKNVIDFVLKSDPTNVVSTVMAPQDPVKLYASIQREMLKNSTLIQQSRARGASALKVARLLESATPTAGVFGSIEEAIKAAGGTQDDASAARTAGEALVQSEAIISLPQGPATDKDIELARRGQPPANASPEYLASYARGIAKLADVEARYFREKNAWLSLYQNPRGFDSSQTIKGSERTLEEFNTPTEKAILKAARESIGTPQEAANRALFEKEFGFDIKLFDEDLDLARKVIADIEKDR